MKKASWILLTVAAAAFILVSLVSAAHAYNTADDYGIAGTRLSKVAAGREAVASGLRGIRGTPPPLPPPTASCTWPSCSCPTGAARCGRGGRSSPAA
jgi:hypothetical protein